MWRDDAGAWPLAEWPVQSRCSAGAVPRSGIPLRVFPGGLDTSPPLESLLTQVYRWHLTPYSARDNPKTSKLQQNENMAASAGQHACTMLHNSSRHQNSTYLRLQQGAGAGVCAFLRFFRVSGTYPMGTPDPTGIRSLSLSNLPPSESTRFQPVASPWRSHPHGHNHCDRSPACRHSPLLIAAREEPVGRCLRP